MNYRTITKWIIISLSIVLIVYDIFPALSEPTGDTISEFIRDTSNTIWFIPYGIGVLCGHFFWPWSPLFPKPERYYFLIGMVLSILIMQWITYLLDVQLTCTLCILVIGIVEGGITWASDKWDTDQNH